MKFGLTICSQMDYYDRQFLTNTLDLAEELGFDAFLLPDHLSLPWIQHIPDPWSLICWLAARTSKIRLGSCVTPLTLHNPIPLARLIATIDRYSQGRVIAGFGVGWYRPDYHEALMPWLDYDRRLALARVNLERVLSFLEGKENSVPSDKRNMPLPEPELDIRKPHPETWFGTKGIGKSLSLASSCDGWIVPSWRITPLEFRQGRDLLSQGRLSPGFSFGVLGQIISATPPSQSGLPKRYFIRGIRESTKSIESYANNGCNYYISCFYPRQECMNLMRSFATTVIESWK